MYYLILFFILTILTYSIILVVKGEKTRLFKRSNLTFISKYLDELNKRNIIVKSTRLLSPTNVAIISIILFVLSVILINWYIGVLSTSIILSIPILVSSIIVSKILIRKNKKKISSSLPMYAINLKNYITEENNIISAIMKASVEPPLDFFINKFKQYVSKGINVVQALEMLDKDVGVKRFSDLIVGIKMCYLNGGDFTAVLEKYIAIITKETATAEETEEKAFSSIMTLIIMCILNVIVVIFILNNKEYANIIKTTFVGKLILNMNAISYMLIAYLVSKIYKEE